MNTKRTHRLLPLAIALVMALSLLPTKAWGYNDLQGSGTEVSPYLITSARALESLAKQVNDGTLKTDDPYGYRRFFFSVPGRRPSGCASAYCTCGSFPVLSQPLQVQSPEC